jgi:thiol-disulfide isomerase/thioredoxin
LVYLRMSWLINYCKICSFKIFGMKKYLLLFLIPLLSSLQSSAQSAAAYKLDFIIDGLKDTTLLLGHYYGEGTYSKDTAYSKNGAFTFDGKKPLPPGVYFIILGKAPLFELLIGVNQKFSMATSVKDYRGSMKVSGDYDNQLFFDNMRFNMERNKEADPWVKIINDSTLQEDNKNKKEARATLMKINEKVLAYQNSIIEKYPESFTAKIMKTSKKIDIPEPPKKVDGTIDSTFALRYYREHFFDNFDLSDEALIRLPRPVYSEKINEYLDKLFVPDADTLTRAINKLIAKTKNNQETYKYLTWTCLLKYQQPKFMGLDQVYVNLYDQYFASGQMDFWVNDKLKQNLKEQADKIRSSALGRKSNNLILQDMQGAMRSLHNMANKYTVVFFYDPDCGHCRKETPKLVAFKNSTKLDVGIYAVAADSSMKRIREFVKEMKMEKFVNVSYYYSSVGHYRELYDAETTPTYYVIDREKKIIGRKLPSAEEIGPFLERYEKFQEAKNRTVSKSTP